MNTSITSNNETASSLLELLETNNIVTGGKVDISGVSKITGTSCEIRSIINSGKFTGISSPSFIINGPTENDDINYFTSEGLTIGS